AAALQHQDDDAHLRQAGPAHLHLPLPAARGLRNGRRGDGETRLSAYEFDPRTRMTDLSKPAMLRRVRFSIVATFVVVLASACVPAPVAPTATPVPASPSFVAAPSATTPPPARKLTRPAPFHGDPPILLRALPEAGTFASRSGQWRYDGVHGTLEQAPTTDEPLEHPAPSGTLVAIEHQGRTPAGYAISNELAIRDGAGGPERVVYRAPELFYWSGWSPDGRYTAVWEVDFYSGSVDLDGRPLLVIDAATGALRSLPHEPGYVEEGARPSHDGTRLLVLRRKTVPSTDLHSIADAPIEVWLTDADGAHGTALMRVTNSFGYYGWDPGPSEWDWSE